MSLVREVLDEKFIEILSNINIETDELGKAHLLNIHTESEIFYMLLLNKIYGWNLNNANSIKMNYPGIDLIDEMNKIAIQVTADYSSKKIKKTIQSKIIKELVAQNYTLKFCFIGIDNRKHKKLSAYDNIYNISYNPANDDITLDDLINDFAMIVNLDKKLDIVNYLEKETGKKFRLTQELSKKNLNMSLKELGARYTPDANVDTSINEIFSSFVQDQFFTNDLCKITSVSKKVINHNEKKSIDNKHLNEVYIHGKAIANFFVEYERFNEFSDLKSLVDLFFKFREGLRLLKRETELVEYYKLIALLNEFYEGLDEFFVRYDFCKMTEKKVLIVSGKAGIGKSHTLANYLSKLDEEKYLPFMLLGQKFMNFDSPVKQIISLLGADCSMKEFLDELEYFSRLYNKKIVIGIDAINEGKGRQYWKDHILELVEELSAKNVSLILTIRTDYENAILNPSSILKDNRVAKITHYGFEGIEFEAISEYCQFYKLNKPVFPFIDKIYESPLLLKLTCEALTGNGIMDFPRKFTYEFVFDNYIKQINTSLGDELGYQALNLVDKALLEIVSHPDFEYGSLSYEKALVSIKKKLSSYTNDNVASIFLDKLIERNILNYSYYKEDNVIFAFEILGDYYEARQIVSSLCDKEVSRFIEESPKLKNMISDTNTVSMNHGCLTILSSLLPNTLNVEIYSLCEFQNDEYKVLIGEMFVDSLLWRTHFNFEDIKEFLADILVLQDNLWREFIYALNRLSILDDDSMNVQVLNHILCKQPLEAYEYIWTQALAFDSNIVDMIDWVWKNSSKIERKSLLNLSILMSWMTAATKPLVRDHATKALVNLLIQMPENSIELINNFSQCPDDYVLERIFAAIYGAFNQTKKCECWEDISNLVYQFVFCGTETYPNIIIRKYALLIIEKQCQLTMVSVDIKYPLSLNMHSYWPDFIPTNEEIDNLVESVESEYGAQSREYYVGKRLVHSMTTEYGRGTGGYGDFGRYTFGYCVGMWKNQYTDQELSNIITYDILKNKYSYQLFVDFDGRYVSEPYVQGKVERIGKKYQWIGMHRLLARLLDNVVPTIKENIYSDTEKELVVIEGYGIDDSFSFERRKTIGVKETKIEHPEYEVYERIKDIDPTYYWYDTQFLDNHELMPKFDIIEDIDIDSFNSTLGKCRIIKLNGIEYINIYTTLTQTLNAKEKYKDQNTLYWSLSGCLVSTDDYASFVENRRSINNNGIPYEPHIDSYLYGFYDSFIYKNIVKQIEKDQNDIHQCYINLIEEYFWEASDKDQSLNDVSSITLPLPSKYLMDYYHLEMDDIKQWMNQEDKLVIFIDEFNEGKSVYINYELFKQLLEDKDFMFVTGEFVEIKKGIHLQEAWQMTTLNVNTSEFELSIDEKIDRDVHSSLW